MPVAGWLAGSALENAIKAWDHWVAFGILLYVGGKMLVARAGDTEEAPTRDPTRGLLLIMYSVATSIDALAVGFSLAILGLKIIRPAVIIGLTAGLLTMLGLKLGQRFGRIGGPWIERIGGLILIAIGLKTVIEHELLQ
jgi:putative Mn2+ efflux pump MntP